MSWHSEETEQLEVERDAFVVDRLDGLDLAGLNSILVDRRGDEVGVDWNGDLIPRSQLVWATWGEGLCGESILLGAEDPLRGFGMFQRGG